MQKRDFETYQKRFQDFEILPKFSETHVFRGTIHHPLHTSHETQAFTPVEVTWGIFYFHLMGCYERVEQISRQHRKITSFALHRCAIGSKYNPPEVVIQSEVKTNQDA